MELHEALARISEIRAHVARVETFRGFRAVTVAFSGLLTLVGAGWQAFRLPDVEHNIAGYLTLWIGIALVSLAVTGLEIGFRCHRAASPWTTRLTVMAVEQFVPCVLTGALMTFVLVLYAAQSLWMLPGLWSIVFGLGVFAACRLLPRAIFWVAGYYVIAGAACLAFSQGADAFSPWAMVGTFGVGQLAAAAILYFALERSHDPQPNR